MKPLILILLLVSSAIAGNYVEYGHFQSGYFDDMSWQADGYLDRIILNQWVDWPDNLLITNIRGSVIDGEYYEIHEFVVPEPATMLLLVCGVWFIKRK